MFLWLQRGQCGPPGRHSGAVSRGLALKQDLEQQSGPTAPLTVDVSCPHGHSLLFPVGVQLLFLRTPARFENLGLTLEARANSA